MYDNYDDRSVSLAHREAVRLAAAEDPDGRFFKIALSMMSPDDRVSSPYVRTPCCFWTGMHRPKTHPILLAGRASRHGISVARYLWMLRYGRVLPPKFIVCHSCGNRKCVAPDHLFASPNMASTTAKLREDGVLHKCIRDGALYRIWHESGNHGYLATPPEWGIDYESEPCNDPSGEFDLVEWAAGILGTSVQEVVRSMNRRSKRRQLSGRVTGTERNPCCGPHGADMLLHLGMHGDDLFEKLLDMDHETLVGWNMAAAEMRQREAGKDAENDFGVLEAVTRKMLADWEMHPHLTLREAVASVCGDTALELAEEETNAEA